jgi:hypothetical protein
MDHLTTWAQHHGTAAVEALVAAHPKASADHIRQLANRWHATENLPAWLAVVTDDGDSAWALTPDA